jgi:hypothetical protein
MSNLLVSPESLISSNNINKRPMGQITHLSKLGQIQEVYAEVICRSSYPQNFHNINSFLN